jgi:hypothetical protein
MELKPHGVYTISVKNGLIYTEAEGPFNADLMRQYKKDFRKCIERLSKPCGEVTVYRGTSVFTEEALVMNERQIHRYIVEKGLVAAGIVLLSSPHKGLIKKQVKALYAGTDVEYEFFDDVESAEIWVRKQVLSTG